MKYVLINSYPTETTQRKLLLQGLRPSETTAFGYKIKGKNHNKKYYYDKYCCAS
jgi:hypothetical protein